MRLVITPGHKLVRLTFKQYLFLPKMIRRTFKARGSRTAHINKSYRVWWSKIISSNKKSNNYQLTTILNHNSQHQASQRGLIIKNPQLAGQPRQMINSLTGYQPLWLKKSVVTEQRLIKTQWQTITPFVNAVGSGVFSITVQFNNIFLWILPGYVQPLYKRLSSLPTLYDKAKAGTLFQQNYSRFNNQEKVWSRKQLFKNLSLFLEGPAYSYRERFSRTLLYRNKYYDKHALTSQVSRLKY